MADGAWVTLYPHVFRAFFTDWDDMNDPSLHPVRGPARTRKPLFPVPGPTSGDEYNEMPHGPLTPPILLTTEPAPSC